jgi:CDP-diacylglycerol--glycerol-3-phosphate 3-phosphatidyltransferase
MFSLVTIGRFPWTPVLIIAARELFISLYRVYWGRRGLAVPARSSAKLKTLVQSLAVGCALMPPLVDTAWVWLSLLWVSVGLAVFSAAQYLLDGNRALTTMQAPTPPE